MQSQIVGCARFGEHIPQFGSVDHDPGIDPQRATTGDLPEAGTGHAASFHDGSDKSISVFHGKQGRSGHHRPEDAVGHPGFEMRIADPSRGNLVCPSISFIYRLSEFPPDAGGHIVIAARGGYGR